MKSIKKFFISFIVSIFFFVLVGCEGFTIPTNINISSIEDYLTTELPTSTVDGTTLITTEPNETQPVTTQVETTEPNTTEESTTEPNTTEQPTTEANTTEEPTTELPTTLPTTQDSNTTVPTTDPITTEVTYDTIAEVKAGTVGDTYTSRGYVVGKTHSGILIEENDEYIYVYMGETPSFVKGDYVEVIGSTSEYGEAIQFASGTLVTKLSTQTHTDPSTAYSMTTDDLNALSSGFDVGEYIELSGEVIISGNYVNMNLEGTNVVGSLHNENIDFSIYNNEDVIIKGYILYLSGSGTYLNVLVTDIEIKEEVTYDTIAEVKAGTVGNTYTSRGYVVGKTHSGILIEENDEYIYVYMGETPSFVKGDYVEVIGSTSEYGEAIQFASGTLVTKLSTQTHTDPSTAYSMTTDDLNALSSGFDVGEYIELSGEVVISGNYVNMNLEGTNVVGSLHNENIDFSIYNNEDVIIKGYILYLSGSGTYLNVLVTDIEIKDTSTLFDLTILTINDLHGHIEQDDSNMGGIANTAYLIDQIRNESPLDDVVLIANGDMFQGTAISNMTYGSVVIEIMNMMAFDAMGIGNHEFDWDIENILVYFDGDESNGEADFPLLNANIYVEADDSLMIISNGNMFEYTIVNREGVEVGIISYVGDIYSSIAFNRVNPYYFDLDIAGSVQSIATDLKTQGVDVIVVNIHDGNREDIRTFSYNQQLADLVDSNGDYLVDIVLNGHAHALQADMISRDNGSPLLLIQAGGNNRAFGEIELTIDTTTMDIVSQNVHWVDVTTAGTNYDTEIENYIQDIKETLGDPVLAQAGETITNTSQLQTWVGNVMIQATGADLAISNTGGIRSTGGITAGENVNLSQLYEISPFDNQVVVLEMTYEEIMSFVNNTALFYVVKSGLNLQAGQTYKVSIIDFVYYWTQLDDIRTSEDIDTGLYIRDLLVEDIQTKGDLGEIFNPISDPSADIEVKVVYYD